MHENFPSRSSRAVCDVRGAALLTSPPQLLQTERLLQGFSNRQQHHPHPRQTRLTPDPAGHRAWDESGLQASVAVNVRVRRPQKARTRRAGSPPSANAIRHPTPVTQSNVITNEDNVVGRATFRPGNTRPTTNCCNARLPRVCDCFPRLRADSPETAPHLIFRGGCAPSSRVDGESPTRRTKPLLRCNPPATIDS